MLVIGTMLAPLIALQSAWRNSIGWIAATAVPCALAWLNLWSLERSAQGLESLRALVLTSGVAAPALFLSGSAVLGALSLVLAGSLSTPALLRRWSFPQAGLVIGTSVLTALVLEGVFYASLPIFAALSLAAAPTGIWITVSKSLRTRSALAKAAVLVLVLSIFLVTALVLAWLVVHRA
jgi:hypothetical protein